MSTDADLPTGENWAGPNFTVPPGEKSIQQLVIEDLAAREKFGISKYGRASFADTPDDPREGGPLGQAYNEAMDLVIYLRWYIARHGTSAAFAFGALQAIESGEWDKHLPQLAGAIRHRMQKVNPR
jgi:hypothetical protein